MLQHSGFSAVELAWMLQTQRQFTLAYLSTLSDADWLGPQHPSLNPPLWEWLHLNWFAEFWCCRYQVGAEPRPALLEQADARFNSSLSAHALRWQLSLPTLAASWQYGEQILQRVLQRIERGEVAPYFVELSVYHEAMHEENYMRRAQRFGQDFRARPALKIAAAAAVEFGTQVLTMGAEPGRGFSFDNEQWAHAQQLAAFVIDSEPVSETAYAEFVSAGGYERRHWWSESGWAWREKKSALQPLYWRRDAQGWWLRDFQHWRRPDAHLPMRYVNAFEAEAYCAYAGRQLPTPAQWQAAYDAINVYPMWEWTATPFHSYPGFSAGPYVDYSQPSFGFTRELRGHSPLLHTGLCRRDFRNFFAPQRRDICAGFRTCAALE